MVQILPQETNLGAEVGRGLGGGLAQGLQTGINQGRLAKAFDSLKNSPNANYQQQLAAIAPTLLTTPGGAQALEALAPLMSAQANQEAVRRSIESRRSGLGQGVGTPQPQGAIVGQANAAPSDLSPKGEQVYRQGQVPTSPENVFPQITAGPQPQPEMSPRQLEDYTLDIMENSLLTGKPLSYAEANNIAQNTNNQIRTSNQQILKEKQLRDEAQKALTQGMVSRAQNNGLIKSPEDQTAVEKFALEARNSPNEAEGWEYVRSKMRSYDDAKSALKRELGLTNPIGKVYRMTQGSYKDQQQLIKDIQRPLQKMRDLGLYDEARSFLTNDLGFGNEQTNRALFPLSKQAESEINSFPENTNKSLFEDIKFIGKNIPFPGNENSLNQQGFSKFKEKLGTFLSKNPQTDLVTLRAELNQGKKYAWQDIYKAIDELTSERRFTPDIEQEKQLNTIRQHPTPGLLDLFRYYWNEKQ